MEAKSTKEEPDQQEGETQSGNLRWLERMGDKLFGIYQNKLFPFWQHQEV